VERERCTELCTKPRTDQCLLCDVLDEADAFWWLLTGGFVVVAWSGLWWFIKQARHVLKGWVKHFGRSIIHEGGYRIVIGIMVTLMGAYAGLYAIVEAKHERHLNRALFERSAFMTMVVAGPSGFQSAMNQFAQIQNQMAPIEPTWSTPWQWFDEEKPNREPLRQWAKTFLHNCKPETCGRLAKKDETGEIEKGSKSLRISLSRADLRGGDLSGGDPSREIFLSLVNYLRGRRRVLPVPLLEAVDSFEGGLPAPEAGLLGADLSKADLSKANLSKANLSFADLSKANLSKANLSFADLSRAKLSFAVLLGTVLLKANLLGADLRGANLSKAVLLKADLSLAKLSGATLLGATLLGANLLGADLNDANLRGADLRGADLNDANLRGADLSNIIWDKNTIWPKNFKPPPSR